MAVVTLLDLVQNGTLDAHVGALLWTIAEEKRWMVTAAVPRKAGKTTVLDAALQFVPRDTSIHRLDGTLDEIVSLGTKPDDGYLFPGEISTEPPVRYIWGERVTALFQALRAGFSLATTMHAVSVEDVFDQICRDNGVGDKDASKVQYVIYVERRGESEDSYSRRVAGVYEVAGAERQAGRALAARLETSGRHIRSDQLATATVGQPIDTGRAGTLDPGTPGRRPDVTQRRNEACNGITAAARVPRAVYSLHGALVLATTPSQPRAIMTFRDCFPVWYHICARLDWTRDTKADGGGYSIRRYFLPAKYACIGSK